MKMGRDEVIDRLQALANSKSIIKENKEALFAAIDELKNSVSESKVKYQVHEELKEALNYTETWAKGTPSEKIMRGYSCGIAFCNDIMEGRQPHSIIPTKEQIQQVIDRVKEM